MVTGGHPDPQARMTEVIDIIDPTRTCAPLQEFPEKMQYGLGGAILDGSLVACGRHYCYKYENDAWSQFGTFGNDYDNSIAAFSVIKGKIKKYN